MATIVALLPALAILTTAEASEGPTDGPTKDDAARPEP